MRCALPRGMHRAALALLFMGAVVGCTSRAAAEAAPAGPLVIHVTAKRFSYEPKRITLKVGVPVVLEFTSADRAHGFKVAELGLRADIEPGKVTRLAFTPTKTGTFIFACDVFCGDGHEDMSGELVVTP